MCIEKYRQQQATTVFIQSTQFYLDRKLKTQPYNRGQRVKTFMPTKTIGEKN